MEAERANHSFPGAIEMLIQQGESGNEKLKEIERLASSTAPDDTGDLRLQLLFSILVAGQAAEFAWLAKLAELTTEDEFFNYKVIEYKAAQVALSEFIQKLKGVYNIAVENRTAGKRSE